MYQKILLVCTLFLSIGCSSKVSFKLTEPAAFNDKLYIKLTIENKSEELRMNKNQTVDDIDPSYTLSTNYREGELKIHLTCFAL